MRILFVENNAVIANQVIAAFLTDHEVTAVPTISEARASAVASHCDAVLVEDDLDDGTGDELIGWRPVNSRMWIS